MNVIAFLCKTPDWAEKNNCGQFNGYVAVLDTVKREYNMSEDNDDYYEEFNFPYKNEITLSEREDSISKVFCGIYPLTAISQEFIDNPVWIYGFDTCHAHNSWEKDTYDSVKAETLEWRNSVEQWLKEKNDECQ